MGQATSTDEYSHIDAADKQCVREKVATVQKWLEDQIARKPKNVILTSAEMGKKRDVLPIMTRVKPKPTVPYGTQTPKGDEGKEGGKDQAKDKEGEQQKQGAE